MWMDRQTDRLIYIYTGLTHDSRLGAIGLTRGAITRPEQVRVL